MQSNTSKYAAPMTMERTIDDNRLFQPFEAIREDLLKKAKAIQSASTSCANQIGEEHSSIDLDWMMIRFMRWLISDLSLGECCSVFFCLPCTMVIQVSGVVTAPCVLSLNGIKSYNNRVFSSAIHGEIFLLSRYFLLNPSLQAFHAYKKHIQEHQDLYASRKSTWGKYPDSILKTDEFSFKETIQSIEQSNSDYLSKTSCCSTSTPVFAFDESSALMLLVTLPYLSSTQSIRMNEKESDFTLLHKIVVKEETPIAILCILALLDCGANPNILGRGALLSGKDLNNHSAIQAAKRLNKAKFFSALTNGESMENVVLPQNKSEQEEARRQRELAEEKRRLEQKRIQEKAKADRLLAQCLQYILNNEVIEKLVTVDNKEHFLQTAIALLETSSHFATFKYNVLNRQDYDLGLYTHFKQETNRSIRDLKLKFSSTQCQFEQSELVVMFSNVVLTYQRELDQHECIMKTQTAAQQAHQATINTQTKVAEAANERNNMLFHEQEERRQRAERAADEARTRAQFQQGMKIAQFAINNMNF